MDIIKKRKKTIGIIFVLAGILIIVFACGRVAFDIYESHKLIKNFNSHISADTGLQPDSAKIPKAAIGVLGIGKLDLVSPIQNGMDEEILRVSLGHDKNSAFPGETGNCVLAGHRNYSGGLFFNRLNEIAVGDGVKITTKKSVTTYEVSEVKVVTPDDLSVLEPTAEATITLITCTPDFFRYSSIDCKG